MIKALLSLPINQHCVQAIHMLCTSNTVQLCSQKESEILVFEQSFSMLVAVYLRSVSYIKTAVSPKI